MGAHWTVSVLLICLTAASPAWNRECWTSESIACKEEFHDLRTGKHRYHYASDNVSIVEMCKKQISAVHCVNSFAEECLSDEERHYFQTLVLGFDKFFDSFCTKDSALRKKYLKYSPCMQRVSGKLDACSESYKEAQMKLDSEEDDAESLLQKTCCIYFENIRCSSNATSETCGPTAGQLVTELWSLLSGTYLKDRCQPFAEYDPGSCTLTAGSPSILPGCLLLSLALLLQATFLVPSSLDYDVQ